MDLIWPSSIVESCVASSLEDKPWSLNTLVSSGYSFLKRVIVCPYSVVVPAVIAILFLKSPMAFSDCRMASNSPRKSPVTLDKSCSVALAMPCNSFKPSDLREVISSSEEEALNNWAALVLLYTWDNSYCALALPSNPRLINSMLLLKSLMFLIACFSASLAARLLSASSSRACFLASRSSSRACFSAAFSSALSAFSSALLASSACLAASSACFCLAGSNRVGAAVLNVL